MDYGTDNTLGRRELTRRQDDDLLVVNRPGNLETCQPYNFVWTSTVEDAAPLILTIFYDSETPVPSRSSSVPLPTQSNGIPTKRAPPTEGLVPVMSWETTVVVKSFKWDAVNLTEGAYLLYASAPSVNIEDQSQFFVYNGSDVSCLSASSLPSSSGTGVNPPYSTNTVTPAPPVPVGASSSSVNIGAIVGGVVGGVVLITSIIIAYFFFIVRRRRRQVNETKHSPPSIKSVKRGKGGEGLGQWKGLGSVDMHDPEGNTGGFINGRTYSTSSTKVGARTSEDTTSPSLAYTPAVSPTPDLDRRASLTGQRKTARKPVPSYLNTSPASPLPASGTTTPTFDDHETYLGAMNERKHSTASSSSALTEHRRSASTHKRELKNTYADLPKDAEEEEAEAMVRGLKNKASFGDMMQMKPVHYLMPDMPLEERQRR